MTLEEFDKLKVGDKIIDTLCPEQVGEVISVDPDEDGGVWVDVQFDDHSWPYRSIDINDLVFA